MTGKERTGFDESMVTFDIDFGKWVGARLTTITEFLKNERLSYLFDFDSYWITRQTR
jgi:hypothetical protein